MPVVKKWCSMPRSDCACPAFAPLFYRVQQLAEKRARDEAEEAEKSGKVELRTSLKPKIDAWAAGKKVRGWGG